VEERDMKRKHTKKEKYERKESEINKEESDAIRNGTGDRKHRITHGRKHEN
jgi:hypothetical protein